MSYGYVCQWRLILNLSYKSPLLPFQDTAVANSVGYTLFLKNTYFHTIYSLPKDCDIDISSPIKPFNKK